ncbi:4-hydroxybenzoate 3-monooxygenase [Paenibacillus sp. SC116]|uniref:4-hydroxybenzoate 3-monooxygenase n=1 Tax=Paenibacillus sp. SC116 TaxID=2968986 RepID=UPI00215A60E8|nr:4-hydroxybenzoate 3-monooxygenase [Paenibacillus sp. SC116]MCR8846421.1 4-hydroxybenzoate 3-monooxygenase [Paenibacillus sp. SC116]
MLRDRSFEQGESVEEEEAFHINVVEEKICTGNEDERVLRKRTQVCIVGAGPAGLILALLLQQAGIACIVVERQTREYVETRARAGFLEHRIVEFLRRNGFSQGLDLHGAVHTTCEFRLEGRQYMVPYGEMSGCAHTVYPQQFVVKDLIQLFISRGGTLLFSHPVVEIEGLEDERVHHAVVTCHADDKLNDQTIVKLECDFVAGCDGFHGIARASIPPERFSTVTKQYGIGWLALLAEVPSSTERVIYALHESGFAGQMPRTPQVTRFYLECSLEDSEADWPEERIWSELCKRMAVDRNGNDKLAAGRIIERRVLEMRSVVTESMQYGRLFLAGDAAHIITPVGAKGMNLAIADAEVLAEAFIAYYRNGDETQLNTYTEARLPHVWQTIEFSDWMLRLIHNLEESGSRTFSDRLRRARLERLCEQGDYAATFAANYVGK